MRFPSEDRYLQSQTELQHDIAVALGGRAAEDVVFNEVTGGACSDLSKATQLATRMVCEWGMSDKMGPMTYRRKEEEIFLGRDIARDQPYSDRTAEAIDSEVKRVILDGYSYARKLILDNRAKLDRLVEKLMEKETLDSEEVLALIGEGGGAAAGA